MHAPLGHMLAFLLGALVSISAPAQASEGQPKGLMWNRTGLPLVFPLQVKTRPGADYYLVLKNAETGQDALAAYIIGGDFFRVLVPPGTFHLHFAYGTNLQGEQTLFGPRTRYFRPDKPLTFKTRGLRTKAGWIVDLTPHALTPETQAQIQTLSICQRFALAKDPNQDLLRLYLDNALTTLCDPHATDTPCKRLIPNLRLTVQSRVCF